ncbi:MAG: hypothetical protein R3B48_21595 [Kofleriaceae bacterium]
MEDARGKLYPVVFYDCVRLAQDLEYEVSVGRMCIAEPGLSVLPAVTLANMELAVHKLEDEGVFANLVPSQGPPVDS